MRPTLSQFVCVCVFVFIFVCVCMRLHCVCVRVFVHAYTLSGFITCALFCCVVQEVLSITLGYHITNL